MQTMNSKAGLLGTAAHRRRDGDAELPRYKLTARAYFDRVYEIDEEVETELPPGRHMEPVNSAARRMKRETPEGVDPQRALNTVPRHRPETTEDVLAALLSRVAGNAAQPATGADA